MSVLTGKERPRGIIFGNDAGPHAGWRPPGLFECQVIRPAA